MSTVINYYCDVCSDGIENKILICKVEIEKSTPSPGFQNEPRFRKFFDLCESCSDKVITYITGSKDEDD